jgi:putative transposase
MRYAAITAQVGAYPIVWMCHQLTVSVSGYYAWRERPESQTQRMNSELVLHVKAVFVASRETYGSPRVYQEMKAQGIKAGENRIAQIMRENGISCPKKRSFIKTTQSGHGLPIAPNLLERNFSASAPNQKWATDLTYIATAEGFVYLASIIDLFSRRIVGWAVADNMAVGLTLTALQRAIDSRHPPAGLVHHSDRGSQYASNAYRAKLAEHNMLCSMSAKGECWDNAVPESFFGRIKEELIHRFRWESKAHVMGKVGAYIDGFYNPVRRHSAIDFLSPIDYELAAACREPLA